MADARVAIDFRARLDGDGLPSRDLLCVFDRSLRKNRQFSITMDSGILRAFQPSRRPAMPQRPQTLLQVAGAPLHPSPWNAAALVIIDHQEEYRLGGLPLSGLAEAVAELRRLLAAARDHAAPVFHVVHHGRPGGRLFDPVGPMAAILPELAPIDGEVVVRKALPNAFAGTDLEGLVRRTGRTELIIAGFATHMCVSATTRAALDRGFRTTVVAGAVATRDLPDPLSGDIIPAATLHRAELAALADRFAVVVADTAGLV